MSLSRSSKTDNAPTVSINIIPLVDVSLVLLIIFMVTATFMKNTGMNLQLPSSSVAQVNEDAKRDLVIGVAADGSLLWEGAAVSENQLAVHLLQEAKRYGTESRVTVRGDARAAHGRVVEAMTLAQSAGFSHLVIATRKD
ncbi:MAG TPA: biopolymer transporter ExbD [Armatimonadota bacterium]|jgi:biopolymer transport protein ExbD